MKSNPFNGFGYAFQGAKLILQPGLRRFFVIPLLVNVLVFSILLWGGGQWFSDFMNWLLPEDSWLAYFRWLLWPLFALSALLIVFYTFTTVANLIASPFNGLLAEKVELFLTGEETVSASDWLQITKDILPSLYSELRKLLYFALRAIPLLLLFLIPGLNLAAPFLWLAFNAWFLAMEYGDYPMGNHRIRFKVQHDILAKRRSTALFFGGALTFLMMIPVVNFLVMPAGVAGATVFWVRELKAGDAVSRDDAFASDKMAAD